MTRTRLLLATLLMTIAATSLTGCVGFRYLAYMFSPRQKQKAEFTFPGDAQVLVMIEAMRPEYENPVFNRALFDRTAELFKEKKSTATLISPLKVISLRREHEDFAKWSLQRVGRELNATHVLWIKVDKLQIQPSPDTPVLEPVVDLRMKVIAVDHPETEARVWPDEKEKEGRPIHVQRQADVGSEAHNVDTATVKLARDTAQFVHAPFFEIDLEEPTPVEH